MHPCLLCLRQAPVVNGTVVWEILAALEGKQHRRHWCLRHFATINGNALVRLRPELAALRLAAREPE
jgi:hypothetical protein